ncbi:unnamed protein product [marine sediment metagenome]|uniref:Uncharacterized protein n=1 Tax=marine sediment metagenome TaxID=412755 RepID=X1L9C1_9ZZZZ
MVSKKDVTIVDRDKVPPGKLVGAYTFLRDMGNILSHRATYHR